MNNTIFNFSYDVTPIVEVVVEPEKELPQGLVEAFDKKIACFTNKVPVITELSDTLLQKAADKAYDSGDKIDTHLPERADKFNQGNKFANRKRMSPDKVTGVKESAELTQQKYTAHLIDQNGKKSSFSKKSWHWKTLSKSHSDFDAPDLFSARQKMTHITDAKGNTVWSHPTFKVEETSLSEMSKDKYDAIVTGETKKLKASINDNPREPNHASKVNSSLTKIRLAKEKARMAKVAADATKAGYHQESVKSDTEKTDPSLSDNKEFSKKFDSGIKKNVMPGMDNMEPIEKPDRSKKTTEDDAPAEHGPNINQEPMHKIKGTNMESVTFSYRDLSNVFSDSLLESKLADIWEIEIYEDSDVCRFSIKDGDDLIAEGTNLTMKSAAKSAYRKCLQLESRVVDKVEQPSRVLDVIKKLNK